MTEDDDLSRAYEVMAHKFHEAAEECAHLREEVALLKQSRAILKDILNSSTERLILAYKENRILKDQIENSY